MKDFSFDESHKLHYENYGYVVIENFLNSEEINDIYNAVKELCLEAPKERKVIFTALDSSAAQDKETFFLESGDKVRSFFESKALNENGDLLVDPLVALNKIGHALHTKIDIFKKVTFSDKVKEVCKKLGYVRPAIPQSMYIFKNPKIGEEVVPHQDGGYLRTEPMTTIGFWIAIDDATLENGCLEFIKGSQRLDIHRNYIRNPDKNAKQLTYHDVPLKLYPEEDFTKVPINKGSCILIHSNVVHKSDPNTSEKSRQAYTFHIVETHNCEYSKKNWLQPPEGEQFPVLYDTRNK